MIKTQRTTIRAIDIRDEPDLFDIYKRPEVFENFGIGVYSRGQHLASIEKAVNRWQELGKGDLVAVYKSKVIARLILFPFEHEDFEIGYVLNPEYWGMGLGTEIAEALTNHAFKLGACKVKASARETNKISTRIIIKLGYTEVERKLGEDGISRVYFQKLKGASGECQLTKNSR
ncbi:GNAT family N-acetyltransferase [Parendozoicomonas haliclonae]|uniref:Acetyltransferase (GNAT) family protein n=1 Tax=Parendozoicomonas haliclonae TaxID=1960125 RepID=A0A1X7AGU8_9GAMM|nr:GNAT family N-acetyltransferase [Parendozoicomonas haliclonae]SMA40741.1 Acetyltransferase (GNAT) family protein [Parendozoicomonas haliclonae]